MMKYHLVCGEMKANVAVEGWNSEGEGLFSVEGRNYRISARRIADDTILMRANGRAINALIARE